MGPAPGIEPAVVVVEAAPVADCGQGVSQAPVGGRGVAHRVGAHRLHPPAHSELGQGVVAMAVQWVAVVPKLHEHVAGAGRADQLVQLAGRGPRSVLDQRRGHRAAVRAGEDRPPVSVSGRGLQERLGRQPGLALAPSHVGPADQRPQRRVPGRVAGQHHRRPALLAPVGRRDGAGPAGRAGQVESELSTEHCGQASLLSGLGEPHHPVEAVPVGQCQSVEFEPDSLSHQLIGVRRAVHEAEPRVCVQLRVRHPGQPGDPFDLAAGDTPDHIGSVGGRAGTGGAWPVRPVRPWRRVRPVRQAALQLPPGDDRVVEPHTPNLVGTNVRSLSELPGVMHAYDA